jgi:hypothetical protein
VSNQPVARRLNDIKHLFKPVIAPVIGVWHSVDSRKHEGVAQKALYSSSRILPPGSLPLPFPPVAEPLGGEPVL